MGTLDHSGKRLDLKTRAGSDLTYVITLQIRTDDGPPPVYTPLDLTGMTARARAQNISEFSEVDFDVDIQSPETDGRIQLTLTHTQTIDMTGTWRWEMSLYDGADSRRTYVYGNLSVLDFGPEEP